LFHPGKSAAFTAAQREFAWLGELHPLEAKRLKLREAPWLVELDLGFILETGEKNQSERRYAPLSVFPGTTRDLSLVVDEGIPYGDFEGFFAGERQSTPLLQEVTLVSVYQGDPLPAGKKSLSFRLSYASPERTLTDDEVNAIYFKLIDKVKDQKKVEIR
jgi:phenylalanyl-tRNA synthetase beta chain